MKKITTLRTGRSREKRVNVFLDGRFAFSLGAEVAVKEDLQVGQELSSEQVEALARSDNFHRCLSAALNYLGYRPRSEFELKDRLQRRGFAVDCIEAAITKLKEQNLVDDMAFARFWKNSRESFSPRSQRLTGLELRRKGVSGDIINQVVHDVDDEDSAYRAAVSRSRRWPRSDYQGFRHRLGQYLRRRGFNYEILNRIVERVWRERENSGFNYSNNEEK